MHQGGQQTALRRSRSLPDRVRIGEVREEERRRLGLELHDGAGQLLVVALIRLEQLSTSLLGHSDQGGVDEVRTLLQQTLDEVRGLSRELRPPTLERLGLGPALAELAAVSGNAQLRVELRLVPQRPRALPLAMAAGLFRIAQAAVGNSLRHSRASTCSIALVERKRSLRLEIEDDGVGFDSAFGLSGLGLAGMRERAAALGGLVAIDSSPERGTRVRVEVPLPAQAAPGADRLRRSPGAKAVCGG